MALNKSLLNALISCVGSQHVLIGEQVNERAKHFWNPEPRCAAAIIRPASTDEVAKVLRLCHSHRQTVVTHGGLTGLVDGDRTTTDDIALSMERMNRIEAIDTLDKTMTVEAGCLLETIQQSAAQNQLSFGLDLGARGSCTIGGNIATNAGGLSVLRYGMTREQVLGLEVVLMDGTVLSSMNTLVKNNAGFDLKHLFIGTEGTLGVITRAVVRLRPATSSINTALLACENFSNVTQCLQQLDYQCGGNLHAFEVLWKPVMQLNTHPDTFGSVNSPIALESPYYIICETRGADFKRDADLFQSTIETCFEQGLANDGVIAQSSKERTNIWAIRENIESMLAFEPHYVFDVSLRINTMEAYVDELNDTLQKLWPGTHFFSYGHLADGNLHLIIAPPSPSAANNDAQHEQVNQLVYERLAEIGGSISAEHGIGFSKKPWLTFTRSAEEIQTMQSLKQLFDPLALLNHGLVIDPC